MGDIQGQVKAEIKTVEKWRIVVSGTMFTAPEFRGFYLEGLIKHPTIEVEKGSGMASIKTSALVGEDADSSQVVYTQTGSRYRLGEPEHTGVRTFAEMQKAFPGVRTHTQPRY